MKSDLSDGMSNHSDFSNDSQNSVSTAEFLTNMGNGVILTQANFISLEGLNSGVPTRTTPTLTPTTLRNIEQTFIELQSKPESHENEAGFVPPLVHSIGHNQYISASDADSFSSKSQPTWHSNLSQSSSDCDTRLTPPLCQKNSSSSGQSRRNMGGRKPTKDLNCSPEEEERRRIRRERNKAAAARCRKRRVDHTNSLISETEDLEQKKQKLQDEMLELQQIKDHLEYLLDTHKVSSQCRLNTQSPPDIKPYNNNQYTSERVKTEYIEPMNDIFLLPSPTKKIMFSTVPISKPTRPNTLNVGATAPKTVSDILGGPISTPSSGLLFNFESLMGGGTGLTPVSVATPLVPSCSSQQRNIPIGLATSNREIILPDRNYFFNFDF